MNRYGIAHYDLDEIKDILGDPAKRIITRSSRLTAVSLGYAGDNDMVERVKKLKNTEIHKSMDSLKKLGLWQDVYITNDNGVDVYIKLQKSMNGKGVIISFKKSE